MKSLHRRSLARLGLAIIGLAALAAARMIPAAIESRSGLVWIAIVLCLLSGGACWATALLPPRMWDRLSKRSASFLSTTRPPLDYPRTALLLIGFGILFYLVQVAVLYMLNDAYEGQDEHAYLITAAEIRAGGGTLSFIESLYTGDFREANRHPLYLWLLSFWPTFKGGKSLSVLIGITTFAATLLLDLRIRSRFHAGLLSLLLGCNLAFARFSTIVGSEVLLTGIVGLLWMAIQTHSGTERTESSTDQDRNATLSGIRFALFLGASMALCWLAKGTGLLLTFGTLAWLFIRPWLETVKWDQSRFAKTLTQSTIVASGFVAAWIVIASPLLVRNINRYSQPFYNVNSWLMFVDEYSDPVALSQQSSAGHLAAEYWAAHSIGELFRREVTGLFWETFILLRMLGPPLLDDARVIPGTIVALLALLGAIVQRGDRRWLLLIWLLVCVPMFAWYVPIAAGERFVLPLLIPILFSAADGAEHLVGWLRSSHPQRASS